MRRSRPQLNLARREPREPLRELRRLVGVRPAAASTVCDHDYGSARGGRDVRGARQLSREPLDRRGLRDVERLAAGDGPRFVDEADRPRDVRAGKHVCQRAAQFAGTDDRDFAHRSALLYVSCGR